MKTTLETAAPFGARFYLDTSALCALAFTRAGTADPTDRGRAKRLRWFAPVAQRKGGAIVTSVLAFQELAAKVRNASINQALDALPHRVRKLRDLHVKDAKLALRIATDAKKAAVAALNNAVLEATQLAVAVEQPATEEAERAIAGERMRIAHQSFIDRYPRIDAMDALHLTYGMAIDCEHFVSFDYGWEDVAEVTIVA